MARALGVRYERTQLGGGGGGVMWEVYKPEK